MPAVAQESEAAPQAPAGTAADAVTQAETAAALTTEPDKAGPHVPVDKAYGAYQRGHYLTALSLAMESGPQQ